MIVLSLGGSLIVDSNGINVNYLKRFVALVKQEVKKGKRFLICCGGGATARAYGRVAATLNTSAVDLDLHWIGIRSCHLNEELIRVAFGDLATAFSPEGRRRVRVRSSAPIIVGRVGKPGASSDASTVKWAHALEARVVYNLTNVDGVYDCDPRKNKKARHFSHLTWKQYARVLGVKQWKPNAHAPFDPIASRLAARWGISAIIMNGGDLRNFGRALSGKSFRGTRLGKRPHA